MSRTAWAGLFAAVLGVAGVVWWLAERPRFEGAINAAGVDLAHPDAYVSTPALSRLPRDLLKAPVARDLLTDDFAFYYEEHEDRLDLRGAMKRIAFEHDTTLSDKLVELALDQPAEIAWWADAKGAPRHWLLAMTQGALARGLQELASLAANDRQLSVIDRLAIGGTTVPVYALTLSSRRTFALATRGNRVVVMSDPGLLFDSRRRADPASLAMVANLLSGDASAQSAYRRGFGLGAAGAGHTLVADVRLMSFGYQHFFPGLKAVRVELASGGSTLRTLVRVDAAGALPADPADRSLWSALPSNPAACTVLPADWARVKAVLADAARSPAPTASAAAAAADSSSPASASASNGVVPVSANAASANALAKAALAGFADRLDGPVGVCWYARSQLHTPLFVARSKAVGSEPAASFDAVLDWLLPDGAAQSVPTARAGATLWQREVGAPWGPHDDGDDSRYKPTLARSGRWISFSPDDTLVELALDAQARRYPSIAASLPSNAPTLAVLSPRQIADLLQREALKVAPVENELFRQAVERQLVPRLNALRKLAPVRALASGSADASGWVGVEWEPIGAPRLASGPAAPLPRGQGAK